MAEDTLTERIDLFGSSMFMLVPPVPLKRIERDFDRARQEEKNLVDLAGDFLADQFLAAA